MSDLVSLYSLQRPLRAHRDTLERHCDRMRIAVRREPASTTRYEVRKVTARDARRLRLRFLQLQRDPT